jgi:hypothetical protein
MNVLYSTHTSPDYMPPLGITDRQIIVGPNYPTRIEERKVLSLNVTRGRYDLAALVSSLPLEQKPELTVVLADSFQNCVPENLAEVPGLKLLLIADTHHGNAPLQTMLAYARREPFDRIVVTHDPHHLHWFVEANIAPTIYIPNINCFHFPQQLNKRRQAAICFVGQAGQWHPRRRRLLQAIQNAGFPLIVRQAPASMAAAMYNSMQIIFNCSLNGDLNMRVFEVMAAGGFLITDRLSPQSGLEVLFRRGKHYVDYEDLDDLLIKLRHYLGHPDECLKIANAGRAAYLNGHRPAQRARDLLEFAFAPAPISYSKHDLRATLGHDGFGENLEERVRIYEWFQNLSLQNERLAVVADAALGARAIADLVDLPRLRVHVRESDDGKISLIKEALNRMGVLTPADFIKSQSTQCDIQVMDARTLTGLRDSKNICAQWIVVMTAGNPMDAQSEWLTSQGYAKSREVPWLFQRLQ